MVILIISLKGAIIARQYLKAIGEINRRRPHFFPEVFLDPLAISIYDKEHSLEGDRWITIGKDRGNVVLVVIHTFHQENTDNCRIRLISARKATKKEIKQYEGDEL